MKDLKEIAKGKIDHYRADGKGTTSEVGYYTPPVRYVLAASILANTVKAYRGTNKEVVSVKDYATILVEQFPEFFEELLAYGQAKK